MDLALSATRGAIGWEPGRCCLDCWILKTNCAGFGFRHARGAHHSDRICASSRAPRLWPSQDHRSSCPCATCRGTPIPGLALWRLSPFIWTGLGSRFDDNPGLFGAHWTNSALSIGRRWYHGHGAGGTVVSLVLGSDWACCSCAFWL